MPHVKREWTLEDAAVGERLAHYRKRACMTQEQLATKANVSVLSIRRYECGVAQLPCAVAETLARCLGVAAWRVLYGEDE